MMSMPEEKVKKGKEKRHYIPHQMHSERALKKHVITEIPCQTLACPQGGVILFIKIKSSRRDKSI